MAQELFLSSKYQVPFRQRLVAFARGDEREREREKKS